MAEGSFLRGLLRRDAPDVARHLLGAVLESRIGGDVASGRIVETEAYLGLEDPASHAFAPRGRTARNEVLFHRAGALYVYVSYGVHRCVNVVTGAAGVPHGVLIRALEPMRGRRVMERRRKRSDALCNGPGRLAQALGIAMRHNGASLETGEARILKGDVVPNGAVGRSGRIGVSAARDWPLRYFLRGHPDVKRPRDGVLDVHGRPAG